MIHPQTSTYGSPMYDLNGRVSGYSPSTTVYGGMTKLEYFMLEITKSVVIATAKNTFDPKVVVNRAQVIFEVLKERIEGIEQKGLISDNNK